MIAGRDSLFVNFEPNDVCYIGYPGRQPGPDPHTPQAAARGEVLAAVAPEPDTVTSCQTRPEISTMPMIDAYATAGTFLDKHQLALDPATAVMTVDPMRSRCL
jgi:hypothetical protein